MDTIVCKGKHADLCRTLSEGDREGALEQIYSYFRMQEHSDTYSIQLLTILRELLQDGESEELGRLRIRIRACGDRVLINLAQFVWALETGGRSPEAAVLADKCVADLPRLARSARDLAEEEGVSPVYEMAGRRIREAVRILRDFFASRGDAASCAVCDHECLEVTRTLLGAHAECMAEDMLREAKGLRERGDAAGCEALCAEVVSRYRGVAHEDDGNFSRERYETLDCLLGCYRILHSIHPEQYSAEIAELSALFDGSK